MTVATLANYQIHNLLLSLASDSKSSVHTVGDLGSIPGWGRSPGEGNDNPLQYS